MRRYTKRKSYYRYKKPKSIRFYIFQLIFFIVMLSILKMGSSYSKILNFTMKPIYALYVVAVTLCFLILNNIYIYYKRFTERKRYLKSNIGSIDRMNGKEFEHYLKAHFESLGYKVFLTPDTNDYGADLIITKNSLITVIQAKHYSSKVSNSAVQEVLGAIGFYNADKGMVITNSFYTSNAINLAEANNVELWDRNTLIDKFKVNAA